MNISVIGLGYVGLPLARLLATKYAVIGFDIDSDRVANLNRGVDDTNEVESDVLKEVLKEENNIDIGLVCTTNRDDLKNSSVYIITVPTPVDKNKLPILTPMLKASETVGDVLKKGDIVIYESTVYPGVTEEECVPILEKVSGLEFNKEFFVGYSPERINPGDKDRTVDKILKITSGSTPETAKKVDDLYKSVITAGTHLAPSIKVAEAAKVIENSQRDINIAFVNELSKIFNTLDIDTHDVLEAAGTKWNFLKFKPGLVGGHCIGVDPYYLATKAQNHGYLPEIILSGRRMNDSMGEYVASQVVKLMISKDITVKDSNVLVLGFTFKENCPDVRNTKVSDMIFSLKEYGLDVDIYDPHANIDEVKQEYSLDIVNEPLDKKYNAIILAVAHSEFNEFDFNIYKQEESVIYDIKGVLPKKVVDGRL